MLSLKIPALFIIIIFAATAVAGRKTPHPSHPQATCLIHKKTDYRDTYTIRGRNWNITEAEFISAINSGGTVLSAWEWMEAIDDDSAHVFRAKVRFSNGCLAVCVHERKTIVSCGWSKCWKPCFLLHNLLSSSLECRSARSGPRGRNWEGSLSRFHIRLSVGNRTSRAILAIGSLATVRIFLLA